MSTEKVEPVITVLEDNGDESSMNEAEVIYDEKMTKKLVRKIDWHIMPVLVILYLLSFLDRTNIGNARLANLEKDLGMTGLNYNVGIRLDVFPTMGLNIVL